MTDYWWQRTGGGVLTTVKCPHGFLSVYCYQCQNPALRSPSGVLYQMGGWTCPGCGRCYNPAVAQCGHCPAEVVTTVTDANTEPVSDLCHPSQEGGLCSCDEGEDEDVCRGGRHCSC